MRYRPSRPSDLTICFPEDFLRSGTRDSCSEQIGVPGGDPDPIFIPGKFIDSAFEGTELVLIAPVVGNAIFEQGAEDLLLERIVEKVNYMFAQRCLRESSDSGRGRDELEGSTLPLSVQDFQISPPGISREHPQ